MRRAEIEYTNGNIETVIWDSTATASLKFHSNLPVEEFVATPNDTACFKGRPVKSINIIEDEG